MKEPGIIPIGLIVHVARCPDHSTSLNRGSMKREYPAISIFGYAGNTITNLPGAIFNEG